MLELIGAAAVTLGGAAGIFYAVTVAALMRRGGLENVVPGMVAGGLAALGWVALVAWWLS